MGRWPRHTITNTVCPSYFLPLLGTKYHHFLFWVSENFLDLFLSFLPLVHFLSPSLPLFSLLFPQVDYPEIADGVRPRHRFMSAYEQRLEAPDRQWQYLLFASEPYETIAFKVSKITKIKLPTSLMKAWELVEGPNWAKTLTNVCAYRLP